MLKLRMSREACWAGWCNCGRLATTHSMLHAPAEHPSTCNWHWLAANVMLFLSLHTAGMSASCLPISWFQVVTTFMVLPALICIFMLVFYFGRNLFFASIALAKGRSVVSPTVVQSVKLFAAPLAGNARSPSRPPNLVLALLKPYQSKVGLWFPDPFGKEGKRKWGAEEENWERQQSYAEEKDTLNGRRRKRRRRRRCSKLIQLQTFFLA